MDVSAFLLPPPVTEGYTARIMLKSILKVASVPIFLVGLASAYALLWFTGADSLRDEVERLIADRRAAGWEIDHDGMAVRGFPLRIRVVLPRARVVAPPESGGWTAEAAALRLDAPVWSASRPVLRPAGPLRLDLGDLGVWQAAGTTLQATLDLAARGGLDGVAVDLRDVTMLPASAVDGKGPSEDDKAFHLDTLTAEGLRLAVAGPVDTGTATWTLAVAARGLSLPEGKGPPFSRRWDALEVTARLLGPLPLDGSAREAVTAWRDAGGVLEIDRLYLDWPPLEMALAGTLALDDRLQPVGALSSHLAGFFGAVEALEAGGLVRARDATMARVVLGSMAQKAPQSDRGPVLTLPLTVQNRHLSAGPVALMDMPAIRWSGRPPPVAREVRPGFEIDRFGNILRRD
jgi:hypothetical protein